MANYRIFKDGEKINTIVSDEEFCSSYCAENGYTYELMPEPEPTEPVEPEPTADELMDILLGVSE